MMREAIVGSELTTSPASATTAARAIVRPTRAQRNGSFGAVVYYSAAVASIKATTFKAGTFSAEDGVLDGAALAIGSTKPRAATGAFMYMIGHVPYFKAAVAAGTALGTDVIPAGLYGAVALDIDAAGTIVAVSAGGNAAGHASAAAARLELPAVAAGYTRLGNVTASKSDGDFTFGTTDLDAANTTVAYTSTAALTFTATKTQTVPHNYTTDAELIIHLPQVFLTAENEALVCELAASGAASTGKVELTYFKY